MDFSQSRYLNWRDFSESGDYRKVAQNFSKSFGVIENWKFKIVCWNHTFYAIHEESHAVQFFVKIVSKRSLIGHCYDFGLNNYDLKQLRFKLRWFDYAWFK